MTTSPADSPVTRASLLYASAPDPVLLLDSDGEIRYANPAARAWGIPEGAPLDEVLDLFSRPKAQLLRDHVVRYGFASGWELNLDLGSPLLVSVTALPVTETDGFVLLFVRDASLPILTAQRLIEANEAIDAQNRRLADMLDAQNQALARHQVPPSGEIALGPLARDVLSPREQDVMLLMAQGLSNQEVAERLVISLATVKTHVRHILQRLGVEDRSQAVIQALHRGLIRLG